MARNKRSLAGFGDVANDNVSIKNDIKDNINKNINVNNNVNVKNNVISEVLEGNKKKNDKVLKGIHFDKDVATVLDRLGKKGGRGAMSKIVNDVLKAAFEEKGLL